jgi:hypothetical protein
MQAMQARILPASRILIYDPYTSTAEVVKRTAEDIFGNVGLEGIIIDTATNAQAAKELLKREYYDLVIAGCYKDTCATETSAGIKVLEGMNPTSQVIILSADLEFTHDKLEKLGVPQQKINLIYSESKPLHCWETLHPMREPMLNYVNVIETPPHYDLLKKALATTLKLSLD